MRGQVIFGQVCAAEAAEAAMDRLSDQALADLHIYTADIDSWAARVVHGLALIEGAKRFFKEAKEPNFP